MCHCPWLSLGSGLDIYVALSLVELRVRARARVWVRVRGGGKQSGVVHEAETIQSAQNRLLWRRGDGGKEGRCHGPRGSGVRVELEGRR